MTYLAALLLALFASPSLLAQSLSPYTGNFNLADGTVLAVAEWEIDPGSPHGNLANAMKGNPNLSISLFPTADHAFLDGVTGGNAEIPSLSRFAPGMLEGIRGWLRRR